MQVDKILIAHCFRVPGYPSIQSILSVTGTIDIDKFNRGFDENIEGAEDSTEHTLTKSKAKEETRPVKRPRLLSATELIVDTEDISESSRPVSLWFKKQLVIQLVKETKMDLSAYGYTGETVVALSPAARIDNFLRMHTVHCPWTLLLCMV